MPTMRRKIAIAVPGLNRPSDSHIYSDVGAKQNMPNPTDAFSADGFHRPLFCTLDNDRETCSGPVVKDHSFYGVSDRLIVPHATVSTELF
jgi:hypothetical protein